jgi:hypothetical protein
MHARSRVGADGQSWPGTSVPLPNLKSVKLWGSNKGHADAYGIEITRTIQIPDVGEYS